MADSRLAGIELGCGRNRDTRCALHVDANPNVFTGIELADVTGWVADVSRPFPEGWAGKFDLVVAHDILEHISYRDTEQTLKNWRRLLREGGVLDLMVPDAGSIMLQQVEGSSRRRAPGMEHLPRMATTAWKLLGGLDDGRITQFGDDPDLNLHRALFDRALIEFYLEATGFYVTNIFINKHPNLIVMATAS